MRQTPWIIAAASLLAIAVGPAPVQADATSNAIAQIQAAYNKRDAALNRFDIEGYIASYGKNYKNVTPGTHLKQVDQRRNALIKQLQHSDKLVRHDTVKSAIVYPDGVTVTVDSTTSTIPDVGQSTPEKVVTLHQTHRAFWVHTKMGWRIKQERLLSSD